MIVPDKLTSADIELGARYMNELMCLPAKSTLGSLIRSCEKGADVALVYDSCGQCRLKTYWILQQRALRRLGYNVRVQPITLGLHTPADLRAVNPSTSLWRAWRTFIKVLREIWERDKQLWPPVKCNGQTRIGLTGEIYTLLEPTVNLNLVQRHQKLGAAVHISLPLSYFVFKKLKLLLRHPNMDEEILKRAHKIAYTYFPLNDFGGHGRESIIHSIYYGLAGYDGIVHVMPFPCSPEAVVASIVDDIGRDFNIPVLRLIFDVQSGEAGLVTRLEAFCDMLNRRRARK